MNRIVTLCPENGDFVPNSGKLRKQPDKCPENRVDFSLEPLTVTAVVYYQCYKYFRANSTMSIRGTVPCYVSQELETKYVVLYFHIRT